MSHPLAGIKEKINRADVHLKTLQEESRAFLKTEPYEVFIKADPKTQGHVLHVKRCTQPPLSLGVILGDVVHNLRAALDHLVWQIVLTCGNDHTLSTRTAFPIYSDFDKWRNGVVEPRKKGKKSALLGIDDATFDAIERLQPFNEVQGQINALHILGTLSNIDKHQVVHSSIFALTEEPPRFEGSGFEVARVEWGPVAIQEGAEIARVTFLSTDPDSEVDVKAVFAVDIRFGELDIPLPKIYDVRNAVVWILNFFGKGFGPVDPSDG